MKKIALHNLIEKLGDKLLSIHNYSILNSEKGVTVFQCPEDSIFGLHRIIFHSNQCTCEKIRFLVGQLVNLKNERTQVLIDAFITNLLDMTLEEYYYE